MQAIEVIKTRLGEFDASGRRKPVPTDEIRRIACDTVILAVGETVDKDFARASGLKITEGGTIEVDRYSLETSRAQLLRRRRPDSGASNVSNAMGYGKRAARHIDERLTGQKRFHLRSCRSSSTTRRLPAHVSESRRHIVSEAAGRRAPLHLRRGRDRADRRWKRLEEACRCLRCDVRNGDH